MADENPMGRGSAVALKLPVDQVRFLRDTFQSAREGVRDELRDYPDDLKDPDTCAARTQPTGGSSRHLTSW